MPLQSTGHESSFPHLLFVKLKYFGLSPLFCPPLLSLLFNILGLFKVCFSPHCSNWIHSTAYHSLVSVTSLATHQVLWFLPTLLPCKDKVISKAFLLLALHGFHGHSGGNGDFIKICQVMKTS